MRRTLTNPNGRFVNRILQLFFRSHFFHSSAIYFFALSNSAMHKHTHAHARNLFSHHPYFPSLAPFTYIGIRNIFAIAHHNACYTPTRTPPPAPAATAATTACWRKLIKGLIYTQNYLRAPATPSFSSVRYWWYTTHRYCYHFWIRVLCTTLCTVFCEVSRIYIKYTHRKLGLGACECHGHYIRDKCIILAFKRQSAWGAMLYVGIWGSLVFFSHFFFLNFDAIGWQAHDRKYIEDLVQLSARSKIYGQMAFAAALPINLERVASPPFRLVQLFCEDGHGNKSCVYSP